MIVGTVRFQIVSHGKSYPYPLPLRLAGETETDEQLCRAVLMRLGRACFRHFCSVYLSFCELKCEETKIFRTSGKV